MTLLVKAIVLVSVSTVLLSACTISKDECLRGDWQTIGFKDGKDGRSPEVIQSYAKSCAKHGTTPDATAYSAGFDVGIVTYCTPENGFDEGENNRDYSGACPANLEKPFLDSYIDGLQIASGELEIEYDRESLQLDVLRDRRDRRIAAGSSHSKIDKEIKYASSELQRNTRQRRSINQKVRRWKAR